MSWFMGGTGEVKALAAKIAAQAFSPMHPLEEAQVSAAKKIIADQLDLIGQIAENEPNVPKYATVTASGSMYSKQMNMSVVVVPLELIT